MIKYTHKYKEYKSTHEPTCPRTELWIITFKSYIIHEHSQYTVLKNTQNIKVLTNPLALILSAVWILENTMTVSLPCVLQCVAVCCSVLQCVAAYCRELQFDATSCDSFTCVIWLIHMCVPWRIHTCDMTHSYVWQTLFTRAPWRIHMCDMTHSYVCCDVFTCVPWRIHMYDMTRSYVRHYAFTHVPWRIHVCDMTYSYVWHDTFPSLPWHIHMCDMTHSYVWHNAFRWTNLWFPKYSRTYRM